METVVTSYKLLETLHYFRRIEVDLSGCGLGVRRYA